MRNLSKFSSNSLSKTRMRQIKGGITISEYQRVCAYLAKHNPEQLAAVQAQFDAGTIQFEDEPCN